MAAPTHEAEARLDLAMVELLCSRLCHDLISPVGAVNNGVELLRENDPAILEEAVQLVGRCGEEAGARLQFFRAAYGRGGGFEGIANLTPLRDLAGTYLKSGKMTLVWSKENLALARPLAHRATKLVLNLILLASEALPLGGDIRLDFSPDSGKNTKNPDGMAVTLSLQGEKIRFADSDEAILRAGLEGAAAPFPLDPRTIQGYFTGLLARCGGTQDGRIVLERAPERLSFAVRLALAP